MEINKYTTYWLIIFTINVYALLKQRSENGCFRFSIERQCDDDKSVYVLDTIPNQNDNISELNEKLVHTLSHHEKAGIWKICLIITNVFIFFVYLLLDIESPIKNLIPLHLSFFVILYFYFNYINYHFLRRIKNNGIKLINELNKKCFNKSS